MNQYQLAQTVECLTVNLLLDVVEVTAEAVGLDDAETKPKWYQLVKASVINTNTVATFLSAEDKQYLQNHI